MKLLRNATVTVCTLAILIALGAAYLTLTQVAARDISRSPERIAAVPVESWLESAPPAPSLDTASDHTPADPHACQQPTLAPPEEDLEPLLPAADPALSVHFPPRPGRHVIYVQVEARQGPPKD
ncbi:MAG: hypothetical protein ABIP48_15605 [Planctomycetota bacterium]